MTFPAARHAMADVLRENGVTMAGLEAAELLACATGLEKQALIAGAGTCLSAEQAAAVQSLLARRLAGEPLAYLIGQWDFCGLTLDITPDVLIPRADTELLAEMAWRSLASLPSPRVLDLCSGSGCIGLSIAARVPHAQVTLCDLSERALALSARNAAQYNLTMRYLHHDAMTRPPGHYDLVVCNPPYIAEHELPGLDASVRDYEPLLALRGGSDGLAFYRAIAGYIDGLTERLMLECGQGQARDIAALFAPRRVDITLDTQGIERNLTVWGM